MTVKGRCWDGVGTVLGRCWDGVGTVLGRCWDGERVPTLHRIKAYPTPPLNALNVISV
jgi:hypothetical protein